MYIAIIPAPRQEDCHELCSGQPELHSEFQARLARPTQQDSVSKDQGEKEREKRIENKGQRIKKRKAQWPYLHSQIRGESRRSRPAGQPRLGRFSFTSTMQHSQRTPSCVCAQAGRGHCDLVPEVKERHREGWGGMGLVLQL